MAAYYIGIIESCQSSNEIVSGQNLPEKLLPSDFDGIKLVLSYSEGEFER